MVDIEIYRARIGGFGPFCLSSTLKHKTHMKWNVQIQMFLGHKPYFFTFLFLCIVISTTMMCVSVLHQEQGNPFVGMTNHFRYSGSDMFNTYLYEYLNRHYLNVLQNFSRKKRTDTNTNAFNASSYYGIYTSCMNSNNESGFMFCKETVYGTCSYLLGNVGLHMYNGNPSTKNRLQKLHLEMIEILSNIIAPNTNNEIIENHWKKLMHRLRIHLSVVEISNLGHMLDVFDALMAKGVIHYGQYNAVKKIMTDLELLQCVEIIKEYENKTNLKQDDTDGVFVTISDLQAALDDLRSEMKADTKRDMITLAGDLRSEMLADTKEQRRDIKSDINFAVKSLRMDINATTEGIAQNTQSIDDLRSHLTAIKEKQEMNLAAATNSIKSEMNSAVQNVRSDITATANDFKGDISAVTERIAQTTQACQRAVGDLRSDLTANTENQERIAQHTRRDIGDLRSDLTAKVEKQERMTQNTQRDIVDLKRDLTANKEKQEMNLASATNSIKSEMNSAVQLVRSDMTAAAKDFKGDINAVTERIAQSTQKWQRAVDDLSSDLTAIKEKQEMNLAAATNSIKSEMNSAVQIVGSDMTAISNDLRGDINTVTERIAQNIQEWKKAVVDIRNDLAANKEKQDMDLTAATNSMKSDMNSAMQNVRSDINAATERIAQNTQECQRAVGYLRSDLTANTEKQERLTQNTRRDIGDLRSALIVKIKNQERTAQNIQRDIGDLKSNLNANKEKQERDLTAATNSIKSAMNAAEQIIRSDITVAENDLRDNISIRMAQNTQEWQRAVVDIRRDLTANKEKQEKDLTAATNSIKNDMNSAVQNVKSDISDATERIAQNAQECQRAIVELKVFTEKWREEDEVCSVTKGVDGVLQKICSDEHSFVCVVGVAGSGKNTAIRHAALYLEKRFGYTIYLITHPKQFIDCLDISQRQVFIMENVFGKCFVDLEKLAVWDKYDNRIKNCLGDSKTVKFLASLRTELYSDDIVQERSYIFNNQKHLVNLSDHKFILTRDEMKNMLIQHLQVEGVRNTGSWVKEIWPDSRPTTAEDLAVFFPLICDVFKKQLVVKVKPRQYFNNPVPAFVRIFKEMKSMNKYQYCGLLLCAVKGLSSGHVLPLCQAEQSIINALVRSQNLDPKKDLEDIQNSLKPLQGVYISKKGNNYTFLHPIFLNIVVYLKNDQEFFFKYATRDFITSNVKFSKQITGAECDLVYGSECLELLVNRMIQELASDNVHRGARFITNNRYIDNGEIVHHLTTKLFALDDTDAKQNMINRLFNECVYVLWKNPEKRKKMLKEMSWPCFKLTVSLITKADCNTKVEGEGWWCYPIHLCIDTDSFQLTKLCVEHGANINASDYNNRNVLHYASQCENNVQMTGYLFSLENLRCLDCTDKWNKTPYTCVKDTRTPNRREMIKMYKRFVRRNRECALL